jgi:hypothetical protein
MANLRSDDTATGKTRFRSERLVQDGGKWFFLTREGTSEGPFASREEAIGRLQVYIRLAMNELLPTSVTQALCSQATYSEESNG